jgi:hypothetical protein
MREAIIFTLLSSPTITSARAVAREVDSTPLPPVAPACADEAGSAGEDEDVTSGGRLAGVTADG